MKIVFDSDFDRGAWPGPLEGRSASAYIDPLAVSRRLLEWRDFSSSTGGVERSPALRALRPSPP